MRFFRLSSGVLLLALTICLLPWPTTSFNPLRLVSSLNRTFSQRECTMCRFSVGLISYALETKRGADQVYRIANVFCSLAHIETPVVCSSISKTFNKEIVKVLRYGLMTPSQICGLLSNNSCGHFNDPLADWEVNLNASQVLKPDEEPVDKATKGAQPSSKPFRIIQLSDTHIDLKYEEGSAANCAEPLCCQSTSTPLKPVEETITAGPWGSYADCDVPVRTLDSTLKAVKRLINESRGANEIDYIVLTGDIQPHDVWKQDKESANNTFEVLFSKINEILPDERIYFTFGNHEMVPVDSFSPSNLLNIAREDSPGWVYKKLYSYWSKWLGPDTMTTALKDGFYATQVRSDLKIISLNTNFGHDKNFWLYINSTDPGNMLQWLVHELILSELEHQQVHIIGHIPPGADDCLKVWSKNYNRIIRRFSNTISGQFFGHTHNNEFEIFYDFDGTKKMNLGSLARSSSSRSTPPDLPTPTTTSMPEHETDVSSESAPSKQEPMDSWLPTSVGWIGPSMTTFANLNPAFRVYTIDPSRGYMPIEMETYYMNLTEANAAGAAVEPKWYTSGPLTKLFGIQDTSPLSMHNLLMDMIKEIHEEENYILEDEIPLYQRLFSLNAASLRPINEDSKLYKLFRLYNSYSDAQKASSYSKLNKKEYLCSFFSAQAHNPQACNKFIYDSLSFEDIAHGQMFPPQS